MKISKILAVWLLVWVSSVSVAQTGKVTGGFIGGVSLDWYHNSGDKFGMYSFPDKNCSFHIGYQSQFELKNRWSLDAALLYGQRRGKFVPILGHYPPAEFDYSFSKNYLALNGIVNYNCFSRFKLGVGVEPTVYFKESVLIDSSMKAAFDIPLVVKASYAFRYFEVSLAYKNGFCNVVKGIPTLSGDTRARDLQLSIYVPIFRR